ESPIPTVLKAAKMAHEAGATVVLNPAPACALPEEIFRYIDLFGAKQNGLKSCGVLFGYGSREELEKAGADFIAKDISALKTICMEN
ncbi:MAG: hypothetical protein IIT57_09985, partial [Treponema sp.]|nr:hypothetical protein [Treponema sp.]